jgi:hypothetical protein
MTDRRGMPVAPLAEKVYLQRGKGARSMPGEPKLKHGILLRRRSPPIVGRGWVGEDQVGEKGWAKLGDGLVAPEVTGEGAINPWQPYLVAPVGSCEQPANGVHSPSMLTKGTKW